MTAAAGRSAAFVEASRELQQALGQGVRRAGPDTVRVPSRTRAERFHNILIGLDGSLQCDCEASFANLECWALKYVREERQDMTTSTALVPIKVLPPERAIPTSADLADMTAVSAYLAAAGGVAVPSNLKKKEDIMAVVLAGWEVGVKPMTALRHISVINGKTEPDGQLMAGIVLAKEPDASFDVTEDTDDATTVRFTRPSRNLVREYRVTNEDAKLAGLLNKSGPWTQFPRDMRRWHAYKRLSRAYAPDIINGIASVTLGDLPTDGLAAPDEPEPHGTIIDGASRVIDNASLYSDGDAPGAPTEHGAQQETPVSASDGDSEATSKASEVHTSPPPPPATNGKTPDAMTAFWTEARETKRSTDEILAASQMLFGNREPKDLEPAERATLLRELHSPSPIEDAPVQASLAT